MYISASLLVFAMVIPVSATHTDVREPGAQAVVELAELSLEQRTKLRGEMREMWSRMTPEERELLRREHQEHWPGDNAAGEPKPQRAHHDLSANPPPTDRYRQMSTEEHHYLRRQLKELSADERR